MDKYTIKQMADKLGITKNTLKYRMKNMPDEYIDKTTNINYIKYDGYQWLIDNYSGLKTDSKTSFKTEINHKTDSKTSFKTTEYDVIKIELEQLKKENSLLNQVIESYKSNSEIINKELDIKNNQIESLTKLLNQEQQLSLFNKTNELEYKKEIEEKNIEKEQTEIKEEKKSFWKKLFGK